MFYMYSTPPINSSPYSKKDIAFKIAAITLLIISFAAIFFAGMGAESYIQQSWIQGKILIGVSSSIAGISLLAFGILGFIKKNPSKESTHAKDKSFVSKHDRTYNDIFIQAASKGQIRGDNFFGADKWKNLVNSISETELPDSVHPILESFCPFAADGKTKVKDTHMLVLIPSQINDESLTLRKFLELIGIPDTLAKPDQNEKLRYEISNELLNEYGDEKIEKSYWLLMPKAVIPWSHGHPAPLDLLKNYKTYSAPKIVEVAICIGLEYLLSKTFLFPRLDRGGFVLCEEKFHDLNVGVMCTRNRNDLPRTLITEHTGLPAAGGVKRFV